MGQLREQSVLLADTIGELPTTDIVRWAFALVGGVTRYQWDGTAWIEGWGSGGSSLNKSGDWAYKNDVTAADPGAGNVRYNNLDPSLVTEVYISQLTDGGGDASAYLNLVKAGTVLYLQVLNDASRFLTVELTADIVDNTGWYTMAVTVTDSGTIPNNNAIVHADFFLAAGGDVPEIPTSDGVLNTSTVPGPTVTAALDFLNAEVSGTYDEIKALRDSGVLKPGGRYIMTDYQTQYVINGSNSTDIVVPLVIDSVFSPGGSGYLIFDVGFEYRLEIGAVLTMVTLPDGYAGPINVGDTTTIRTIFDSYYFQVGTAGNVNNWAVDETLVGASVKFDLVRYENIANDAIINDTNGKPIMKPGGVINTEVHDGTDYADMTAAENLAVPTEILALIAATPDSFQPEGFSGTFLGDTIYYDMDDTDILDDNFQVAGQRKGRIFRRINLLQTVDLECDWRVQRNRRWLLDEVSRTQFINRQHVAPSGSIGHLEIGARYLIETVTSQDTAARWIAVGATTGTVGEVFTATAVGTVTATGVRGWASKILLANEIVLDGVYDIHTVGDTDFTLIGSSKVINADAITVGDICKIVTVGDTDYTLIGSPDNVVGTIFTATGVGVGTGTVDIGNNVGSRFVATGPGIGTGYVTEPSHTRDTQTGAPYFTGRYRDPAVEDKTWYQANNPEEAIATLDRWAKITTFSATVEGNDRCIDFYTIPIDSSYEPLPKVTKCVFKGNWNNVILDLQDGGVYNSDILIDGNGFMDDVYIPCGLRAGNGSSFQMSNLKSLDWVSAQTGLQGTFMQGVVISCPFVIGGSSSGLNMTDVVVGTGYKGAGYQDNASYAWVQLENSAGAVIRESAIGAAIGVFKISGAVILNSAVYVGGGGTEPGTQNPLGTEEKVELSGSWIQETVLAFQKTTNLVAMTEFHTPRFNALSMTDQSVWILEQTLDYKNLFLNTANQTILERAFDVDNIETIVVIQPRDNR